MLMDTVMFAIGIDGCFTFLVSFLGEFFGN